MSKDPPSKARGSYPCFLPPELDAKVTKNIDKFERNFESFRQKNDLYLNFMKLKPGDRSTANNVDSLKVDLIEPIQHLEHKSNQRSSANALSKLLPGVHENRKQQSHKPSYLSAFERGEDYVSLSQHKNFSNLSQHQSSSQQINSHIPAASLFSQIGHNPGQQNRLVSTKEPSMQNELRLGVNASSERMVLRQLSEFVIRADSSFDVELLFKNFDLQYRKSHPTQDSLSQSFALCTPQRKARVFEQMGIMADELSNEQLSSFLVFTIAFGNDFLLLSVLSRVIRRPGASFSITAVEEATRKAASIYRSRRAQFLLINFINKLC